MRKSIPLPTRIISEVVHPQDSFPNNPTLPLLIYKQVIAELDEKEIKEMFRKNHWKRAWTNGIYAFHHYHANTHEVLGICSGSCQVQLGGAKGAIFEIEKGDVLIIPAGVSHKNISSTHDFVCVGAYPFDIEYDMHEGEKNERPAIDRLIAQVPLPEYDPIYGKEGPLLNEWRKYSRLK